MTQTRTRAIDIRIVQLSDRKPNVLAMLHETLREHGLSGEAVKDLTPEDPSIH